MPVNLAYNYDPAANLWSSAEQRPFAYSDGTEVEEKLLRIVAGARDRSSLSLELEQKAFDWASRYHLSRLRANLLRPLSDLLRGSVLELGAGCGALTRYLAELGGDVVAVEGSARRARIAAERVRGLENARVICDTAQQLALSQRFQAVLLIGVLEYAGLFYTDAEPALALLRDAARFIDEHGCLMLAIENQIGLKYLSGAAEDHTGQPFFGVDDLYEPHGCRTYGMAELQRLLEHAGFSQIEFLLPVPDYKFPHGVILPRGYKQSPQRFDLSPFLWSAQSSDPQIPAHPLFSLEQAWGVVGRNELALPLANSFLVIARKHATQYPLGRENADALLYHFGAARPTQFCKQLRVVEDQGALMVERSPLPGSTPSGTLPLTTRESYMPGELWLSRLFAVVNRSGWTAASVAAWAQGWIEALRSELTDAGAQQLELLPAHLLDATPFNLLVNAAGERRFFDLEWEWSEPLPFAFVVFRGLLGSFSRLSSVAEPADPHLLNIIHLIRQVAQACAISLSTDDCRKYLAMESSFMQRALGVESAYNWDEFREAQLSTRATALTIAQAVRARVDAALASGSFPRGDERSDDVRELVGALYRSNQETRARLDSLSASARAVQNATLRNLTELCNQRSRPIVNAGSGLNKAAASALNPPQPAHAASTPATRSNAQSLLRVLSSFRPRRALREERARDIILRSGLFDASFYATRSEPAEWPYRDPVLHYIRHGARLNLKPNALFDGAYYLKNNSDVGAHNLNPLLHYIQFGESEARNPHPLFDIAFYRRAHARFLRPGESELLHFISAGSRLMLNPHPLFWTAFYQSQLPHQIEITLLAHYLQHGVRLGLKPNPLFDPAFYLDLYEDVRTAGLEPLLHYSEHGWLERRRTHPAFDPNEYAARYPDLLDAKTDLLRHFLEHGARERRIPTRHFDEARFRAWCWEYDDSEFGPFLYFVAGFAARRFEREQIDALCRDIAQLAAANPEFIAADSRSQPRVSILIPVYNQIAHTLSCIRALAAHQTNYSFEIVVIDDHSDDQTTYALPQLPMLRWLRHESNQGFLASCNWGAGYARGEYLLFLNNDTRPLPGWLNELMDTFAAQPRAGLVGSKLLYPDGRLQEAGAVVWNDGSAWNFGRYQDSTHTDYCYMREVDYCSAASLLVPRTLFKAAGGFDPRFKPAYAEDCDLALTIRKMGYSVLYQPFSQIVHFEGVSCGTDTSTGIKAYQVQNGVKLKEKWRDYLPALGPSGHDISRHRDRAAASRILFIDACTPTPDQDAGSLTASMWIQILQSLGCKVTFIPQSNLSALGHYTETLQRQGVECVYHPHYRSIEEYLARHGHSFDAAVVYRVDVAQEVYPLLAKYCPGKPVIFHPMDLHYMRLERQAKLENSLQLAEQAQLKREAEREVCRQSAVICTHSLVEHDAILELAPQAQVKISPLIMPIKGSALPFEARRDICFIGGFNHTPNIDAVKYYAGEILPLMQRALPAVNLLIVGTNAPADIRDLKKDGLKFLGYVEDIGTVLDNVRLSIAPLRYGAGVKGKIGLSMSYGVPVVGTSIALEGMGLVMGEHALLADSPEQFVDQIKQLYSNKHLWTQLSSAGLAFAQREYSPEAHRKLLRELLQDLKVPVF